MRQTESVFDSLHVSYRRATNENDDGMTGTSVEQPTMLIDSDDSERAFDKNANFIDESMIHLAVWIVKVNKICDT